MNNANSAPLPVVVDVETTGLDPESNGVVQIGFAWRGPDGGLLSRTWDCDPGREFWTEGRAAEAFAINGFDEARVARAPTTAAVAVEVQFLIEEIKARCGSVKLYAFNRGFDAPFLQQSPWCLSEPWGRCLMLWAAQWNNGWWPKLVNAVHWIDPRPEILGELLQRAHDAGADASMALLLLEWLQAKREEEG